MKMVFFFLLGTSKNKSKHIFQCKRKINGRASTWTRTVQTKNKDKVGKISLKMDGSGKLKELLDDDVILANKMVES